MTEVRRRLHVFAMSFVAVPVALVGVVALLCSVLILPFLALLGRLDYEDGRLTVRSRRAAALKNRSYN